MREISEYTLLGNYLVIVSDRYGQDFIKYETAKALTEQINSQLNKNSQNYLLLSMPKKTDIVKSMISKGVFRTDVSNKTTPFKQIYNYEVSKYIQAFYACDGSLTFKISKSTTDERDNMINSIKESYCNNLNLDLQKAINIAMSDKNIFKQPKCKIKETNQNINSKNR